MWTDHRGSAVLVTGGTRGIGLATGLAFGRQGADVTLTYKWGPDDEQPILDAFAAAGATPPTLVQADAANDADITATLEGIRARHRALAVIVSNAAFGVPVSGVDGYTRRAFQAGLDASAWPLVSHVQAAQAVFGRAPRYVIGVSSEGIESMHVGYDLIAAAKASLETLCRYLHYRLQPQGTTVNVVRTRFVDTASLAATFGDGFADFVRGYAPDVLTPPEAVADAIVGLCSGPMDAIGGQVVTVDGGAGLFENFSRLFQERHRHPVRPKETA
jgi:NAD(P)-dependent dehydrogenase (short-subunit alcohol dehydrogenase family)